jgi:hypothetical protein
VQSRKLRGRRYARYIYAFLFEMVHGVGDSISTITRNFCPA